MKDQVQACEADEDTQRSTHGSTVGKRGGDQHPDAGGDKSDGCVVDEVIVEWRPGIDDGRIRSRKVVIERLSTNETPKADDQMRHAKDGRSDESNPTRQRFSSQTAAATGSVR